MKPHVVIIGLGNPGKSYEKTRHNAGFRAIDLLSREYGEGDWADKQKFLCTVQEARIVTAAALLIKPQTFMNRSGECIRKLIDFYTLDPARQILILCDDIDIPLGEIRFREKGGPGTHNGLRSIVEQIGEGFPRIRIGCGPPPADQDLATWVLSTPSPHEQLRLETSIKTIPDRVKEFVWEQMKDGE